MVGGEELELKLELEQGLGEEACHLVEQGCQVEQEVFQAELEVSVDLWTDVCCQGETVCGSVCPPHGHLPPFHWRLGVADYCYAGETSW